MIADDAAPLVLPDRLKQEVRRLKISLFLKPERNWVRNLVDGESWSPRAGSSS